MSATRKKARGPVADKIVAAFIAGATEMMGGFGPRPDAEWKKLDRHVAALARRYARQVLSPRRKAGSKR